MASNTGKCGSHTSFSKLTPDSLTGVFAVSSISNHLKQHAKSIEGCIVSAAAFPQGEDMNDYAREKLAEVRTAIARLNDFGQAGVKKIALDPRKDLVAQINALPVRAAP